MVGKNCEITSLPLSFPLPSLSHPFPYLFSYGEIRSPGFLHLYKDRKTADQNRFTEPSKSSDSQATVVDLRAIVDFKIADKKGKEAVELDLELGDETIRLR